jgi:hypothetical protein
MKGKLFLAGQAVLVSLVIGAVVAGASQPQPSSSEPAYSSAKISVPLSPAATPVGSGFTYQGSLKDGANPANGQYDLAFSLYDALSAGTLIAGPIPQTNQTVTDGLFTVTLDFGATAFNGDARYIAISVKQTGGGEYTPLLPRQPVTPAPYALYALKTKGYKNVVTVSQDGADFTSVQAALNSITDNSATNKYLVWVGPGTYTETVTMKQWVDIEGAGEKVTKITFTGTAGAAPELINTGTVVGASNAELRSLTVENTGGGNNYGVAIFNSNTSPSLLNITATASGAGGNFGIRNIGSSSSINNVTVTASGGSNNRGVFNIGSSPSMNNVTVTASGGYNDNTGMDNENNSSPSINNVTVTASGGSSNSDLGIFNGSSSLTVNNSIITGSTKSILSNSDGTVKVGASQLGGGPVAGPVTCAGVYDENYIFYPSTCP